MKNYSIKRINKTITKKGIYYIFYISIAITLIVIVTTAINLYKTTIFHLSYEGIKYVSDAFAWCRIYIGASITLLSIIVYFQQLNVSKKNVDASYISLKFLILKENADHLKIVNDEIYKFIMSNGYNIISNIILEEDEQTIDNKERLKIYFNLYIKNELIRFERAYMIKKFSCDLKYDENNIKSYSLDAFSIVSEYILLPSKKYRENFNKDLKDIYQTTIINEISTGRTIKSYDYKKMPQNKIIN